MTLDPSILVKSNQQPPNLNQILRVIGQISTTQDSKTKSNLEYFYLSDQIEV